jgi:arabinogalactan endo-1,4-beta-galactosidase
MNMKSVKLIFIMLLCTVAPNLFAQKYVGGDISLLPKYEAAGATYYDHNGTAVSAPLTFFKEQGMNAMRVRLFVDPSNETSDANVCQDLAWVKTLGKRIKDAGFKFMLDFHYSDTWADPAKQWTPKDWASLSNADLYTKIYDYTKDVLTQLKAAGAEPDFIQTGNEISYGMLWGVSTASASSLKKCYTSRPANWDYFTTLLTNACKACREVCPAAKIIIHTERVAKPDVLVAFYNNMATYGIDYDIIGLSYYSYFHGNLATLETAITDLEKDFSKDIMIVEAGYPYAWAVPGTTFNYTTTYPYSDAGQKAFTDDLITMLNKHAKVTGLFWWWMEYNAKGTSLTGWYNAPLFDSNTGRATSALSELKNFLSTTGINNLQATPKTTDNAWYTLQGSKIAKPTQPGIYIHGGKKTVNR